VARPLQFRPQRRPPPGQASLFRDPYVPKQPLPSLFDRSCVNHAPRETRRRWFARRFPFFPGRLCSLPAVRFSLQPTQGFSEQPNPPFLSVFAELFSAICLFFYFSALTLSFGSPSAITFSAFPGQRPLFVPSFLPVASVTIRFRAASLSCLAFFFFWPSTVLRPFCR